MGAKAIVLALGICFLIATPALSDAPPNITYQGRLLENGSPVTTPTSVTFELFENQSGGSVLWTDTQSVTPNSDGIYTVALGSGASPLPTDYDTLWLQVTVAGTTLSPRQQLTSSPYALNVGTLPDLEVSGYGNGLSFINTRGFTDVALARSVTFTGGSLVEAGPTYRGHNSCWNATSPGNSLTVDLGMDIYHIMAVCFGTSWRLDASSVPYGYKIEYRAAGEGEFHELVSVAGNNDTSVIHYHPVHFTARYVRITVTAFRAGQTQANVAGVQVLSSQGACKYGTPLWGVSPAVGGGNSAFSTLPGKVGIGTPDPQYKLDVRGAVRARTNYTEEIVFQKDGEETWRIFESGNGLYIENLGNGKVSRIFMEEDIEALKQEIFEQVRSEIIQTLPLR